MHIFTQIEWLLSYYKKKEMLNCNKLSWHIYTIIQNLGE